MPDSWIKTDFTARVTWLGRVADRDAALASDPAQSVTIDFAGIVGEAHSGLTRPSCVRVTQLHPKGTEIRNVRQITILSAEELAETAAEMGAEHLDPGWIGASIVIEGIPDFTHVPPGSRLQGPDGVTLVTDLVNHPCTLAGKSVNGFAPGLGPKYKPAAKDKRGVTAWVEREGSLTLGDELALYIPAQRAWAGLT